MLGEDEADAALDMLGDLAFVEATAEGLALHDAVHTAIVERLRAVDPERFRRYRTAAWHHLQSESRAVGGRDLARSTADLLFLIDNPGPRGDVPDDLARCTASSGRASTTETTCVRCGTDTTRHQRPSRWTRGWSAPPTLCAPSGIEPARSWVARSGPTGATCPHSLERDDPIMAGWAQHAARNPLPAGQCTLVHRRVLCVETGEGPSGPQAAAWLDVKRDYFRLRPRLGRLYAVLADPSPFLDAMLVLGDSSRLATQSPSTTDRFSSPRWTSDLTRSTAG